MINNTNKIPQFLHSYTLVVSATVVGAREVDATDASATEVGSTDVRSTYLSTSASASKCNKDTIYWASIFHAL